MEVNRLPIGVVTRVECTAVFVEFVRENEGQLAAVFVGWDIVHAGRRVLVNESKTPRAWYLSGCIGGCVSPTGEFWGEGCSHRVNSTGGESS